MCGLSLKPQDAKTYPAAELEGTMGSDRERSTKAE